MIQQKIYKFKNQQTLIIDITVYKFCLLFTYHPTISGNRRAGKAGEFREVGGNFGDRQRGGEEAPPQAAPHLPAALH